MLLDLLKANLNEETYTQVAEQLKGKDLKVIPKARFDEVNNAKTTAEKTVSDLEKQYADYDDIKSKNTELLATAESYKDFDNIKEKADKYDEPADCDWETNRS